MMIKRRFLSAPHFGHEREAERRGFQSAKDMDEYIIFMINQFSRKRDTLYLLGDITMEKNNYDILDRIECSVVIVGGNHDKFQHSHSLIQKVKGISGVIDMPEYESMVTHVPIHPREFEYRCKYNIHGHLHSYFVEHEDGSPDKRYINVCCEAVDYKPMSFEELKDYYKL